MSDESMAINNSPPASAPAEVETKSAPLTLEYGLYLLALGLALVFRLSALGHSPLSQAEADYAWQAYQISQGQTVELLSHPAYLMLTGGLFYLLDASDVLARLLPALVGSAVVLLPLAFRPQLGRKVAVVAAFGLAIDPLLVALSRQAGSPLMAVGFAALALWFWKMRRPLAAGIFVGLVVLSGPSSVLGLLVGLVAALSLSFSDEMNFTFLQEIGDSRRFLVGLGFALLAFGTLFMRYPQGLAAMLQAIPDYFATWFAGRQAPARLPFVRAMIALPVYSPLAVLFGGIALLDLRSWQRSGTRLSIIWLLVAVLLGVFNPGRQIGHLAWVLIPLWFLAAGILARYVRGPAHHDRFLVWGGSLFILILAFYWLMNLSMMTTQYAVFFPPEFRLFNLSVLDDNTQLYFMRLLVTIFIPLLILLLTAVVYTGWKGDSAFQIATWGVGAFLLFCLVSAAWGFTDDRTELAGELWVQQTAPGYIEEMIQAVEEASYQFDGTRTGVDIVYLEDTPVLHWYLREYPKASYQPVLNTGELPSMIIGADQNFSLTEQGQFYIGQRAAYQIRQVWEDSPLPPDFDRWLLYRESPVEKDWLFIWTRADLSLFSAPEPEPEPVE